MKKKLLILGCFILFSSYVFAGTFTPVRESVNLKIGLSKGDATLDVTDDENHKPENSIDQSTSINIEYIRSTASGMEYGAGIGAAEIDTGTFGHDELKYIYSDLGDIYSFPVYALIRYKFDTGREWVPYVFGNLGYAFVDERTVDSGTESDVTEIEGGLYTALGVGAEYQEKFSMELMWNKTSMDVTRTGDDDTYEGDLDIEMITLAFGYRLDL